MSQRNRDKGRLRKTIKEFIKEDLQINDLERSMTLDKILGQKLIHVVYSLNKIRLNCCIILK